MDLRLSTSGSRPSNGHARACPVPSTRWWVARPTISGARRVSIPGRSPMNRAGPYDGDLGTFIGTAVKHLEELGYREETLRHYRSTWKALVRFAAKSGSHGLDQETAESFLASRGVPAIDPGTEVSSYQRHLRAAMRVLLEFQAYGCFHRRRSSTGKIPLPEWRGGSFPISSSSSRRILALHPARCAFA